MKREWGFSVFSRLLQGFSLFDARILLTAKVSATAPSLEALEAISDSEMSGIAGQAFITIDTSSYSDATYGDFEYSKVNLGLDIEIMTNVDSFKVGTFEREYGAEGTAPLIDVTFDSSGDRIVEYLYDEDGNVRVNDSDLQLDNFALGRIDNAFSDNPEVVPFNIHNPYLELAYAVDGEGVRRIAGVRIGAESAYGDLSADLISLTGAFQGKVIGTAAVAYQNACVDNNTASWFDCLALAIADDCKASGVVTCFNIGIYDSIYIGIDDADDSDDNFTDNGARGLFASLQSEVVPWKDFSGLPDADRIYAEHGAYLNSAKYLTADGAVQYPLTLDLYEGLTGVQRVPTCIGRTKGC